MNPIFDEHPSEPGIRVEDPIERAHENLLTDRPVDPTPCGTDDFHFPVDVAVAVDIAELRLPYVVGVWVRRPDGELVTHTGNQESVSVEEDAYNVELSGAGIKFYLSVESTVEASHPDEQTELRFGGETRVVVGARSFHERPGETVTVGDDPGDLADALSLFGTALKTTSPERSFPTLRGHPPRIEVGDGFDAPADLTAPETDIAIEVPAERRRLFPVASLAYYLGATVRPGDQPRLVVGDRTHDLDGPDGFEPEVARMLRQTFLFDCVTRTEGYYDVDLHERRQVEAAVDRDLDFASLYDLPLAERVNAYLDVPHEQVAEALPTWRVTADVEPTVEHAAVLPFVTDRLAIVRCETSRPSYPELDPQPEAVGDFYRARESAAGGNRVGVRADGGVRAVDRSVFRGVERDAGSPADGPGADVPKIVDAAETESLEHVWVGDGIPHGGSKASIQAFENQLDHKPESGEIQITVVCNDESMEDEIEVGDIYSTPEHAEVEVGIARQTTTSELGQLLSDGTDFFHFVGHVEPDGLQCRDGLFDVRDLDSVNVPAFFLNGCQSYAQGAALVERGSVGGIVTIDVVNNETATEAGIAIANLLSWGHSLASATSVFFEEMRSGLKYTIIGDAGGQVVHPIEGTPALIDIEEVSGKFNLSYTYYPSDSMGLGTQYTILRGDGTRYLNSGTIGPFELTSSEFSDLIDDEPMPIRVDSTFLWNSDLRE